MFLNNIMSASLGFIFQKKLKMMLFKSWVLILNPCEGTRMWRRGANSDGYVANFVETEQILRVNGWTASYLQVKFVMHL